MLKHVRPYQIFGLLETPPSERSAQVSIPCRRAAGSTTLLETFLIIAGMQLVKAKSAFEFGTFLGANTLNMALNLPPEGKMFTLDLDEESAQNLEQHPLDAPLTVQHLSSQPDFVGSAVASKITALKGNSLTFDFSPYAVDFVFIDGGHDLETAKSDTENSFRMGPRCIMWHDYGSKDYPELTSYLDELAQTRELIHVGDTMLCVWLADHR